MSEANEVKAGDVVRCVDDRSYHLTIGKHYTVVKYEPRHAEPTFTWPAYISVIDDHGKTVFAHAHRFEKVA